MNGVTWSCDAVALNGKQMRETTEPTTNMMGTLAETLSVTCRGEHLHASGTTGRGSTATERYPPEWAARRSEGISTNALETGTGPHMDETGVDASWETWETTTDGPELGAVYTGATLDPIAAGTALKRRSYSLLKAWDAWEMQPRSDAM